MFQLLFPLKFFTPTVLVLTGATSTGIGFIYTYIKLIRHGICSISYLQERKSYLMRIDVKNTGWVNAKCFRRTVYSLRDVVMHIIPQKRHSYLTPYVLSNCSIYLKDDNDSKHDNTTGCYVVDVIYPPHKTFTRFIMSNYEDGMTLDIHSFRHIKWIHVTCNNTNMTPYIKSVYVCPQIRLRHLHLYFQHITKNFNLAPIYEVITRWLDDEIIVDMNTIVS